MPPDLDGDKLLIADNSRLVAHKNAVCIALAHTHIGNVLMGTLANGLIS